jgi:hypothetical protein
MVIAVNNPAEWHVNLTRTMLATHGSRKLTAGNRGRIRRRNPETASRWHQQIRNRPTVEDRPYLGSPDFGLTYFQQK